MSSVRKVILLCVSSLPAERLACYLFPVQWSKYNNMANRREVATESSAKAQIKVKSVITCFGYTWFKQLNLMLSSKHLYLFSLIEQVWEVKLRDFTRKRQLEESFRSWLKHSYLPKTFLRSNSYWQRRAGWQTGCSGND